jgi:hypothetical protein
MTRASEAGKRWAQGVFYLVILALLVSRAVSGNISHDENQFIAPGQFLAYAGLVPYVDYPYTHMPYAVPIYALSALLSDYDLLAGRLMSVLFWLGSIILLITIGRSLTKTGAGTNEGPSWRRLLWELALVLGFVQDASADFVLRAALNHSMATFFSLLGTLFFVRGVRSDSGARGAALLSGACIAAAGLMRFNYASLMVVLLVGWLIDGLQARDHSPKHNALRFGVGALLASLPAIVLAALAPRQFYYGNIAYIKLNTVYYEIMLHREGMDLGTKLSGFGSVLRAEPMQLVLYAALLFTAAAVVWRARRNWVDLDTGRLTIAAIAVTLCITAFAPTPLLLQYFEAPLPYLLILLAAIEIRVPRFEALVRYAGALVVGAAVVAGIIRHNPLDDLAQLSRPSQWPPTQVHDLAVSVRSRVPEGRVLTLQPMVPMEAGLDVYPFTATGPFSWRTSLLLSPDRRAEYHVVSPDELQGILEELPPDAILVGFEEPNPGFVRKEMGGLEKPFTEFAQRNGYTAERLVPPFWPRGLTLWIRP